MNLDNETLEREFLGMAMQSENILPAAISKGLKKDSFSKSEHQLIFETMQKNFMEGVDYSSVSLASALPPALKQMAMKIDIESVQYPNYKPHIETIIKRSWVRSAHSALVELSKKINTNAREPDIEEMQSHILAFSEQCFSRSKDDTVHEMKDVLDSALGSIEEAVNLANEGKSVGMNTGFPKLNEYMYGWQKKMLYVVGARPGVGKTTLALNFINTALTDHNHVAMFSFEMDKSAIGEKLLSIRGKVNGKSLKTGSMTDGQMAKTMHAAKTLSTQSFAVNDSAKTTLEQIKITCKLRKLKGKLDVVVIDYITKVKKKQSKEDFQRLVAEVSSGLKEMAMDLEIPVIALAQLKREYEQGPPRDPRLSDLKESGAIEQDADAIIFIKRPGMNKPEADQKEAYLILAKNRFGDTGYIPAHASMDLSLITPVITGSER